MILLKIGRKSYLLFETRSENREYAKNESGVFFITSLRGLLQQIEGSVISISL